MSTTTSAFCDPFAPPSPPDFTFAPGDNWPMRVVYRQVPSGAPVDMTGDTVTGELWLRFATTPILLTLANGLLERFDPVSGAMDFDPGPAITATARPDSDLAAGWPTRLVVRLTPDAAGDTRLIGIRTIKVLDPRSTDSASVAAGQVSTLYSYLQGEPGRSASIGRSVSLPIGAAGQTVFSWPGGAPPADLSNVALVVDGIEFRAPAIAATAIALTWAGPFALEPSDTVFLRS